MTNKKKSPLEKTINIAFLVIILVIIVLTFGWFYRKNKIKEEQEELDTKIKEVQDRIDYLNGIKEKLEKRKKIVLFLVRLTIGCIFIGIDAIFLIRIIDNFVLLNYLGDILTINGAILMFYSFIAFITYGTITNFVAALKARFVSVLEGKHIDSFDELNLKEIELKELQQELEAKNKELDEIENEKEETALEITKLISNHDFDSN